MTTFTHWTWQEARASGRRAANRRRDEELARSLACRAVLSVGLGLSWSGHHRYLRPPEGHPTIKELIHEQFGDGIMSAINFRLDVRREPDPGGDRVIVTLDGKFLPYQW